MQKPTPRRSKKESPSARQLRVTRPSLRRGAFEVSGAVIGASALRVCRSAACASRKSSRSCALLSQATATSRTDLALNSARMVQSHRGSARCGPGDVSVHGSGRHHCRPRHRCWRVCRCWRGCRPPHPRCIPGVESCHGFPQGIYCARSCRTTSHALWSSTHSVLRPMPWTVLPLLPLPPRLFCYSQSKMHRQGVVTRMDRGLGTRESIRSCKGCSGCKCVLMLLYDSAQDYVRRPGPGLCGVVVGLVVGGVECWRRCYDVGPGHTRYNRE